MEWAMQNTHRLLAQIACANLYHLKMLQVK